jgi:glycosyltransferase involved in cell wall biosynthesis
MNFLALAAAGVFVLPSFSENFGIALLEAMAAGLACISSDQVALAAECEDAIDVVPCESAPLRAALTRLLHDEDARAALGRRAAALAQQRWSLEATGAKLAELYRETTR